MSTLNKLRKTIQEEIKKVLNESEDDPKSARDDAFELTKQARSVAGYKAKIPAYEKALAAHQKAASLMKSSADKKEHLLAAKKLQTDIERFKADMNNGDGAYRSDMKNESSEETDLNLLHAETLGEFAFEAGKERSPNDDHELTKSLDLVAPSRDEYKKQIVQAWYKGYDQAQDAFEVYDNGREVDLDESEKIDDLFLSAQELGEIAFENGKKRVPAHDSKLMSLVFDTNDSTVRKSLMSSWLDGWDARNLAEPVDGLDEADDISDIPFPKPQFEYPKLGQWYQFDDNAYRVVVTDSSEVGMKSSSGKWMYLAPEDLNDMLDSNKVQLISDKSEIAGLEFKKKRSERSDYSK